VGSGSKGSRVSEWERSEEWRELCIITGPSHMDQHLFNTPNTIPPFNTNHLTPSTSHLCPSSPQVRVTFMAAQMAAVVGWTEGLVAIKALSLIQLVNLSIHYHAQMPTTVQMLRSTDELIVRVADWLVIITVLLCCRLLPTRLDRPGAGCQPPLRGGCC
jgi:hypothetical protein